MPPDKKILLTLQKQTRSDSHHNFGFESAVSERRKEKGIAVASLCKRFLENDLAAVPGLFTVDTNQEAACRSTL
jgi:hypothetical protein